MLGADTGKWQQVDGFEPRVGIEAGQLRTDLWNTLGLKEQEKEKPALGSGKAIPSEQLNVDEESLSVEVR